MAITLLDKDLRLFLVIYVDDFKLSGPTKNLAQGWSLLRRRLQIEEAAPVGVYLGCNRVQGTVKTATGLLRLQLALLGPSPMTWRASLVFAWIDIWN